MEFNQGYRLNNGEQIIVLKEFHHYHSDQTDFLIKTANNQNYIISREELAELLKKPRSTEEKLALISATLAVVLMSMPKNGQTARAIVQLSKIGGTSIIFEIIKLPKTN